MPSPSRWWPFRRKPAPIVLDARAFRPGDTVLLICRDLSYLRRNAEFHALLDQICRERGVKFALVPAEAYEVFVIPSTGAAQ